MSNNIYDILKKMQGLEAPKQTLAESKSMDTVKELHKESKKDPVASKGSIAEAVKTVEKQLNEKYMGFKKTVAAIKKGGSAENPEAVAAAIGRKKYGKEKFQKAAAKGKKLGEDALDFLRSPEGIAKNRAAQARSEQDFTDRSAKHFAGQIGDQYHQQLLKTMPSYRDEYIDYISQKDIKSPKSLSQFKKELQAKHDPMGGPTNIDYEKIKKTPMPTRAGEQGSDWRPFGPGPKDYFDTDKFGRPMKEDEMDESALQAYLGKKKYGEEGMKALQQAGREGASKEKMAKIRARHDKMDEDNTGTVPPKHYGGDPAFDLYMARRKEELAKQKPKNEDMLSPKQKKIASMAGDPDKIDADDFAALRGEKKDKKTEGNKFTAGLANDNIKVGEKIPGTNAIKTKDIDEGSDGPEYQSAWQRTQAERKDWEKSHPGEKYYGSPKSPVERHDIELQKARAADQAAKDAKRSTLGRVANTLSRGLFGQDLPEGRTGMREGWEEMQKYLEKKRGPESKGGEGKKAGTRYGGSAQKDDDEDIDGEGKPVEKKKGRPKGTGGGAKHSFKKPKD